MKKSKLIAKSCFLAKYSLIFGITCSMLMACNGGSSTTANGATSMNLDELNNIQTSKNLKDRYVIEMGSGYDSVTNSVTSSDPCLVGADDPNNIIFTKPINSLGFDQPINLSALQSLLNVDVISDIGGDRFNSSSLDAQFANATKDTAYNTNLIYAYKVGSTTSFKPGSLESGFAALTPIAQGVANDPIRFRSLCGNNFVSNMEADAFVVVRLNLNFDSNIDKTKFLQNYKTSSLESVLSSVQQTANISNVPVNITVSVMQGGGNPESLPLLSNNLNNQSVTCSGVFLESCSAYINEINNYAPSISNQIITTSGQLDPSKLFFNNPQIDKYSSLGIPVKDAPDPSPEVFSAMRQLVSQYDQDIADYNFVRHYQYVLQDKLDNTALEELRIIQTKLDNQVEQVFLSSENPIFSNCYNGYVTSTCLSTRDMIESDLLQYQLDSEESTLLNYLESGSYSAQIINYYGESIPESSDYHLSTNACTFAPIGMWVDNIYAVNCGGKWLNTKNNGIIIVPQGGIISISNFNYFSTNPNNADFGQWISYGNIVLFADPFYSDAFKGNDDVSAQNYFNGNSGLIFVQLNNNPF